MFLQSGSNLPILPSQRAPNLFMVPQGIRPVVQLTAIEVLVFFFLLATNAAVYIFVLCIRTGGKFFFIFSFFVVFFIIIIIFSFSSFVPQA